jgi:hypothetical protein
MVTRIKPFTLVFWSITNQGKGTGASIIDRDNQASFSLIITSIIVIYIDRIYIKYSHGTSQKKKNVERDSGGKEKKIFLFWDGN